MSQLIRIIQVIAALVLLESAPAVAHAYSLNFSSQPPAGEVVAVYDFSNDSTHSWKSLILANRVRVTELASRRQLQASSDGVQEWNVFLKNRPGLFESQSRYRISISYTLSKASSQDNYPYLVIRSAGLKPRWRPMPVLEGVVGGETTIRYEFFTGDEADCTFGLGLHNNGSLYVSRIVIEKLPTLNGLDSLSSISGSWKDITGICSHLDWRHFYKTNAEITRVLDLLQKMGIGSVRLCFPWDQLNPKSKNQIDPKTLERWLFILDETQRRNMDAVIILIATPVWASTGSDAATAWRYPSRNLSDYEAYVRYVATRFKGRIRYWEIGNEPNWNMFWMGAFSDYLKELHAASKILREIDPHNVILCAGITDAGLHGLKGSYRNALIELLSPENAAAYDVFSLHYYPVFPEESIYAINNIVALMTQNGTRKPIWVTETGYSVFNGRTVQQQADMLNKIIPLLAAHPDVQKIFIYNDRVKDFEGDPYERGFGLLETDFTPRPAYEAIRKMLHGALPSKQK